MSSVMTGPLPQLNLECNAYPGSNLTLPESTFLSDFVWAPELLHVLAEVALSTIHSPPAWLTLAAHTHRAFHLEGGN